MANRGRYRIILIGASVFAMATVGQAQAVSVDGSVIVGRDARDDRLPAVVYGGAAGASVRVGQRWTIGLEAEWPKARGYSSHQDSTTVLGVRFIGDSRETFRGTMVAVTSGWLFRPRSRLIVTPIIGFGIERRHFTNSGTLDKFDAGGALLEHDAFNMSSTFPWPFAPIGVDVSYALSPRVALTSQWRLDVDPLFFLNDGCCDGLQSRVRFGVRWSF